MNKSKLEFRIIFQICMVIGLLINLNSIAYANSAPVIMEEYPSSEMIVDESNEIIVNHETLTFDLASDLYTEGAKVKASYEMENTSAEAQTVHMVFPLVSNIKSLQENVSIQNDGESVPLEKIYLDRLNSPSDLPDFESVLKQVSEDAKPFLTPDLTCYEFIPQVSLEAMQIEVNFTLTDSQSLILVQNANGYGYDGEKYSIGGWFRADTDTHENLKLYLTKGELKDLKYTIRDSSSQKVVDQSTEFENLKVEKTTISNANMKAMLEKKLFAEDSELYTQTERERMLNEALNELYEMHEMSMIMLEDLTQYLYQDRIVLLSYDIPFETAQKHEITVAYQMKGTFDRRNSSDPTYTFEYFLNPASYWKDFKQLELNINLETPYDYIISSSLPLVRKVDQDQVSYTGAFDQLPESDLTFTVYNAKEITAIDKMKGAWSKTYSYVFFLIILPLIIVVLVILGLIFIIKK